MNKLLKDKKGYIGGVSSYAFGLVGLGILVLIVAALLPIQNSDISPGDMITSLNTAQNDTLAILTVSDNNPIIINLVYSLMNFVLYSSLEVAKMSINYAVENPGFINARMVLLLIIISLSIPIVYYIIVILILIFLCIKEIVQSLADKRKLKQLELTKQNESKRIQNKA